MPMNNRLLVPRNTFTPRSIAGLAAWFDASDLSTLSQTSNGSTPVTANNDPVAFWRCKVTGAAVTQTTDANRPLWKSSGIGGRAGLDFDGSNDALSATTGTLMSVLQNVSGGTLIAVIDLDTTGADGPLIVISNGTNAAQARATLATVTGTNAFRAGGRRLDANSFAETTSAGSFSANPSILVGLFDYANSDLFLRRNGAAVSSNTSFQTDGSTSNTASLAFAVGGSGAALTDGVISELLVYSRALSLTEIARLDRYLSGRYGITIA
jgi:hypothetical protein